MSEDCSGKMLAISSTAAGPSLMPKTFTATNCGSDPESAANNSISDKPAIQIKMVPPSDSKASSNTCKDVIVVNGVDMKTIVVNREKAIEEDKEDSSKLTIDSEVPEQSTEETAKEKTKDIVAKLINESRSTCEFSSDDEVMDTSVLQVIDEVGCSSPDCPPVNAEDATKQGYVEKVSKLKQPENADATQNADDAQQEEKDETDSDERAKNVKRKAEEVKEKTEDLDDYISLLKKRLTCTESEADGLGPSSSKKFKLDDPDDGQHVTVEVDPPFLTYQSDNEQDGKPCRKITKGELQKLVEKLVLEQVSASDRSQLEGLKLKFEQLERCSEKWRKKAFTLQKQITEQQIVIQRQNLTKKPPYILKPQMRSVGLQVDLNRNQGNSVASNRQPQVALLPKAAVTIRPIGPTVSTSPTKNMQGTCVSSNSSNGISVSILQNRARSQSSVLRPQTSPLPVPNVTVTPSSLYQSPAGSRNATVGNKNAKVAPGVAETPAGTSTQPVPVPTRLIPNQSVARQTSTNVAVAKSPSTTAVAGPTVVKFIDLSNDDDSAVTMPPAVKAVTMANVSPCPPNVSVVSSSTGNTVSINANSSGDGRSLTIMTPPSMAAVGATRKMMNLAPMPRSAVAVPISPANLPLRLSTAQVTRPVSQQILHSTNIPNGARVAYLVPTSVALVRPPLNGTIVTQPIQRFAQPATIIRSPITAQAVLFERRVTGPNVSGVVTTAADVARCTTAPTTIMKSIVAGSPTPSIVTTLNTFAKTNTPLIRRLQDECEKGKLQHPAALPSPHYTNDATKLIPAAPSLKVSKESNGIVLSWDMPKGVAYTDVNCYQLYAYQESTLPPSTSLWKKVGDVKALPLPMACTLTQFLEGHKYHFSVRAVDNSGRIGRYSIPGSIMLPTKRSPQTSK